jgi:hypothetical protein
VGSFAFVHREMYSAFFREGEKSVKAVGVGDKRLKNIIVWPCVCIELTGAGMVQSKKKVNNFPAPGCKYNQTLRDRE